MHTTQILRYMFPRQFGLHNVFTSKVDLKETAQPFRDYTLREHEIEKFERARRKHHSKKGDRKVPKRLRGQAWMLVRKIQKAHKNCSYTQLIRHYCPLNVGYPSACFEHCSLQSEAINDTHHPRKMKPGRYLPKTFDHDISFLPKFCGRSDPQEAHQNGEISSLDATLLSRATPTALVSAFCHAVLKRIIPTDCFGRGQQGKANQREVLKYVDLFIRLRKFETLSLHTVSQNIKVGF